MKVEIDTLKCATILKEYGFDIKLAEGLVQTLTGTEIRNIYNVLEIDSMLSDAVDRAIENQNKRFKEMLETRERYFREQLQIQEKRLIEQRQAQDKRIEDRRREFDLRMKLYERQSESRIEREVAEIRSQGRWAIGTIITVGLALAGYLSALIHFTH